MGCFKNATRRLMLVLPLLLCSSVALAQYTISGQVKDAESSITLPGVNIIIKGTSIGTTTDSDGNYKIEVPSTESVLVFSFIGYSAAEVEVGTRSTLDIALVPDIGMFDEIVVVGYGEQKRITTTGAITSVSGDDLVKAPVSGISNALVGLTSGVQALQTSGEFGSDQASIRIRGIATLNRGGSGPLILVDGVERETYNNIDPNAIESINILKDASSTAVFGVRGANGVILITTKEGQSGKPKVHVAGNWAGLQPSILPEYLNAHDYAVLRNEAQINMERAPSFSDEDIRLFKSGEDPIFHPDHNWLDELLKPFSFQQNYNMNISGGSERLRYFTSLGYFGQSGGYHTPEQSLGFPFKHTYDKYNVRINFNFDLSDDFAVAVKLGNQITNNSVPNGGAWGAFDKAASYPPMSSPAFVDGKYISEVKGLPAGVPHFNPWAQAGPTSTGGAFVTESFSNTLNTNIAIEYDLHKIIEGLSVRTMGAYDSYYNVVSQRSSDFPKYTVMRNPNDPEKYIMYQNNDDGPFFGLSKGINDSNKWRKLYGEAGLEYKKMFSGHMVSGLILGTMEKGHYPNLEYRLPTAYMGLVARITYDYKERYLAEVNMGYNGSENFPEGKRFGFFPSFSLGWIPTKEAFFPENDVLTFLKFRGSYGEIGNDKIGGARYLYIEAPYLLTTDVYRQVVFGESGSNMTGYPIYQEGRLNNPDITWERARKWNAGVEVRFFEDKLSFVADYFEEKRDNILWYLNTVPETVAADLPPANIGKVENRGFEVHGTFNDNIGGFSYWIDGAYSFARNKIIYQDERQPAHEWMLRTGRPIDQYFGLTFEGFYNTWEEINDPDRPVSEWEGGGLQPGDMKYKDLNGDGLINEEDMGPIGYSNWPEITYNFSFGASWKGFDLSVLFQGTENVSVYYTNKAAFPFVQDWGPAQSWHLGRWTPERYANGEEITFPRLELNAGAGHNYKQSDFWVQDGSYLRLKNVELGYTFSPAMLRRAGIDSFRMYVSGNNLLTWTDITYRVDPDAREVWGRTYPSMRVFNAGVNFKF